MAARCLASDHRTPDGLPHLKKFSDVRS